MNLKPCLKGNLIKRWGCPFFIVEQLFFRELLFGVKIPTAKPIDVAGLSEMELNAELEKGYTGIVAGRIKTARQTFADIRKD